MEQELKHFGVAADKIWKARVSQEKLLSSNWSTKWKWMLEEYNTMSLQFEELKNLRPAVGRQKSIDVRSCQPVPDTSSRVIGWITHRPEFQLEIYGPYVKKFPIFPSSSE
ncbi:uncharacterized protein C20orf85 homolog [Frankliniella occidentalis]|uniref:Uncharacterized protein C20orf85 homolog n=1 Tax=Frankliniella occidentalis TaxID=133901 RepID=A0A6J1T138_FRAOC|nr:uncharacterized protein C20orf85 homolog [Frankliniella occidentalis]XP_052127828.1 uncharacterized protein C20orf85 homolog [Frankliniella occidentalis]